jgi:hypothetical protein
MPCRQKRKRIQKIYLSKKGGKMIKALTNLTLIIKNNKLKMMEDTNKIIQ